MASNKVMKAVNKRTKALSTFAKAHAELEHAENLIATELADLRETIAQLEHEVVGAQAELNQTAQVRARLGEFLA